MNKRQKKTTLQGFKFLQGCLIGYFFVHLVVFRISLIPQNFHNQRLLVLPQKMH